MPDGLSSYLRQAVDLLQKTLAGGLDRPVEQAITLIVEALAARRPVLVCGNGGSAADSLHIAGELVGRYLKNRPAYKVLSLAADAAVLTAWSNDFGYDSLFARQVEAHGEPGGVLLGLSTSGNSANVVQAFEAARRLGMQSIALTGEGGGRLAGLADLLLAVPSRQTPRIQEVHVCLYHFICQEVEERLAAMAPAAKS